jgi:glyoxylase-like metal-dependent hydrolase (beta-lactamase superfamily II)
VLIGLVALAWIPSAFAQQKPPVRTITRITGDLYRVQNNDHYTVFLVTPAGIILADPINVDAANWLKAQLAERFKNVPVRYVLYSHHHQDHASGAAAFNDTAEIVGHENFNTELKAAVGANAKAAKMYEAVLPPESTYKDRRTITLGGKTVQLIHPGPNHSTDMTVLLFPAERVAFAVDFVAVNWVPGATGVERGGIPNWIASLKTLESLDFDTLAPGHTTMGKKSDAAAHRQYLEDLLAGVSAGIKAGRTLAQIQASNFMDKYKQWGEFDEDHVPNVETAYRMLSGQKR